MSEARSQFHCLGVHITQVRTECDFHVSGTVCQVSVVNQSKVNWHRVSCTVFKCCFNTCQVSVVSLSSICQGYIAHVWSKSQWGIKELRTVSVLSISSVLNKEFPAIWLVEWLFKWCFIMWLCLTRTWNYQIHEFDWLKWILTMI